MVAQRLPSPPLYSTKYLPLTLPFHTAKYPPSTPHSRDEIRVGAALSVTRRALPRLVERPPVALPPLHVYRGCTGGARQTFRRVAVLILQWLGKSRLQIRNCWVVVLLSWF